MLQKTSSDTPTHCSQCKKRIEKKTSHYSQQLSWSYSGIEWDNWCLQCGEKHNQEIERAYKQREEEIGKARAAFLLPIFYATGGYILILGTWESFWGAFSGALAIMFLMFSLNKEKIIKNIDFATAIYLGIFCLYLATTFSIPTFCWLQDFLNIEWLSRPICSGSLIIPGYMEN